MSKINAAKIVSVEFYTTENQINVEEPGIPILDRNTPVPFAHAYPFGKVSG